MLKTKIFQAYLVLFSLLLLGACSEYQRLLKSSDYDLKLTKANEFFLEKEYSKALGLYDELLTIYKGTAKSEEIYFSYSYCHYHNKDYLLAGHYFASFANTFPNSEKAEEAEYMSAYCYYKDSPHSSLDQTFTYRAMSEMQAFINRRPNSNRVNEANDIIDKLRAKLEEKAYLSARLYFDLGDYKAAITALKNSAQEYPDSNHREEILFLVVKSCFLLADNSIIEKKIERFENTEKEYYTFATAFPESQYLKEAELYKQLAQEYMKSNN